MKEEILRILKMVEQGKLDAEKAYEMIEVIQEKHVGKSVTEKRGKILKIQVSSGNHDEVRVNIPVDFIKNMVKAVGPAFVQKVIFKSVEKGREKLSEQDTNEALSSQDFIESVDINMILAAIENGLEGEIVNIQSENDRVYISIE